MIDSKLMTRAADNIRILAASMVERAKSGHPGGAMGGPILLTSCFPSILLQTPTTPRGLLVTGSFWIPDTCHLCSTACCTLPAVTLPTT